MMAPLPQRDGETVRLRRDRPRSRRVRKRLAMGIASSENKPSKSDATAAPNVDAEDFDACGRESFQNATTRPFIDRESENAVRPAAGVRAAPHPGHFRFPMADFDR